jgi:hypothetical protein
MDAKSCSPSPGCCSLCGAGDLCARKNVLPCRHARPSFGRGARSNANAAFLLVGGLLQTPCNEVKTTLGLWAQVNHAPVQEVQEEICWVFFRRAEKRAHHRRLHTATALHVVPVVCCRCLRTTRCAGRPLPRLHGRSAGRSVHDPRRAGRPGCTLALTRSPAPSVARALCRHARVARSLGCTGALPAEVCTIRAAQVARVAHWH